MAEQPNMLNPFDGELPDGVAPKVADVTRECLVCKETLSLAEFSQYSNPPHGNRWYDECDRCRASASPRRAERLRQRQLARGLKGLVAEASKKKIHLPAVASVLAQMYALYGGTEKFCQQWKAQAQLAKEGSKQRLDHFASLVRLTLEVNKQQQGEVDWEKVSEEELEEAVESYLLRVAHPGDEEIAADGEQVLISEERAAS